MLSESGVSLLSNILEVIKQAALDAVKQSKPVEITVGTVASISPLEIWLDQKRHLKESFFTKTAGAMENISVGDTVALIKIQGGQKYLLIDKVVE